MSEPLSNTHNNQTQNSQHNSAMTEEHELAECKIEEPEIETQEIQDILSDECEEFAEQQSTEQSAQQSEPAMDLSPQMMEMLISPYVRRHNEVKSTLIQALQSNHAAMNITRIARKYIYCLYGMIENITGPDTSQNALKLLRDEAYAHEEQLKHWENMYHGDDIEHSLMQAINEPSPGETKSNGLPSASRPSQRSIPKTLSRVTELAGRSFPPKQSNGGQNDSRDESFNNMHPVEMLELSMQTSSQDQIEASDYDDEEDMHNNQHADSHNYGAEVLQSFFNESELINNIQKQVRADPNQALLGDKRPFFTCSYTGCDYSTHNRQRLNMHQKGHTGTPLFYCDVEGCGYLSNFKGNIKIHKRHKHKDDFDGESSPGKSRAGRKRTNHHLLFNDSLHASNSNEQINDATMESSSNDSKKEKDEVSICRFDANTGNYICQWPSCGWVTRWKQLVEPHALGHTGMKPYKCDIPGCDYQTNYKGNVKLHKKKHIKERYYNGHQGQADEEVGSYKCEVNGCDFNTVWKNSFEQHQRNHLRGSAASTSSNSNTLGHSTGSSNNLGHSTGSSHTSINNHHSTTQRIGDPPQRITIISRPQEKHPTRISIQTKPVNWKEPSNSNGDQNIPSQLSSPGSQHETSPKKQSSTSVKNEDQEEFSNNHREVSSHSNSPEPGDEYEDDDDLQFLGGDYVDKPSTSSRQQFIVNNGHC